MKIYLSSSDMEDDLGANDQIILEITRSSYARATNILFSFFLSFTEDWRL